MKKKFYYFLLSITVIQALLINLSINSYAWYLNIASVFEDITYSFIDCTQEMIESQGLQECPECILKWIEVDNVNAMQEFISCSIDNAANKFIINPNQIKDSRIYKCLKCRDYEEKSLVSLIEYAFSCGSINCAKYLLLNKAECYIKNHNYLMMSALISENKELVRIAQQNGELVDLDCISALLRLTFICDINYINDIMRWVLENNLLIDINKYEKSIPSKALSFLLLAESETDGSKDFILRKINECEGLIRMINHLIYLGFRYERGSGHEVICTTIAFSSSNKPIGCHYIQLCKNYFSKHCLDKDKQVYDVCEKFAGIYSKYGQYEKSIIYLKKAIKFFKFCGYNKYAEKFNTQDTYNIILLSLYQNDRNFTKEFVDFGFDINTVSYIRDYNIQGLKHSVDFGIEGVNHVNDLSDLYSGITCLGIMILENDTQSVKFLLDLGAKLDNDYYDFKYSYLRYSVQLNNVNISKLLLNSGANVCSRLPISNNLPSLLQIAINKNNDEMINLLRKYGAS